MSELSESGIARCSCGWSADANTEEQAKAAAVGHSYDTGHLDLTINGQPIEPGTDGGQRDE